jgi:heptosyltransferase-2
MATPALRAIRQGLPYAHIVGVAKPGPIALLKNTPFIDSWIEQPTSNCTINNRISILNALKRENLDAIALLTNSLGTALVSWAARIPQRIGFPTDMRRVFLTHKVARPLPAFGHGEPSLIEHYLQIARSLDINAEDHRMELYPEANIVERVIQILKVSGIDPNRPFVLINNSAMAARSRVWPSQYVVHLCRQISSRLGTQVLLHCGPNDRTQANSVCDQVNSPLVRSMGNWHDLPISVSLAVLSLADVVVTTDSGPRHMAAALNRKVISLFGSTDPQKTRTFNVDEAVLESFQECRPCYKSDCPLKHHRCMRNIEVETVRLAVENALNGTIAFSFSKAA